MKFKLEISSQADGYAILRTEVDKGITDLVVRGIPHYLVIEDMLTVIEDGISQTMFKKLVRKKTSRSFELLYVAGDLLEER